MAVGACTKPGAGSPGLAGTIFSLVVGSVAFWNLFYKQVELVERDTGTDTN